MKRVFLGILVVAMLAAMLIGCAPKEPVTPDPIPVAKYKVGMVTDAGTIDDKSFNQGVWEGIQKAATEMDLETKYLQPTGTTEAHYITEIDNLVAAGYQFIVTPGFKFETAVFTTQAKHKDTKFVIIDTFPHAGDYVPVIGDNTVSILFAEHESGFLAGIAAAQKIKTGEFGFIGGMEVPAVQKFNWGFQQGITYANANFGTDITIKAENVIYQGSFDNVAAGQQLAGQMYNNGVDVIFAAAGGVGVGVIQEAMTRKQAGEDVWVIGVDIDQYDAGIYEGEKSVILTSAMKYVDVATYDMIKAQIDGTFPGGQSFMLDATNDGIGIPKINPNLTEEIQASVAAVFTKIKDGSLVVSGEQGDLIK